MYMGVKLPPKDLNSNPYSPHSTRTYTYTIIAYYSYILIVGTGFEHFYST